MTLPKRHAGILVCALSIVACSDTVPDPNGAAAPTVVAAVPVSAEDSLLSLGYMSAAPGDSIRFALRRVPLSRVSRFLAEGSARRLASIDSLPNTVDANVRLHSLGSEGSCVEGTHVICHHDYLLTVQVDWTDFLPKVYDLGQWGDVRSFEWLAAIERMQVRLVVQNWPDGVMHANPHFILRTDTIDLEFTVDSVWVLRR